MFMRKFFIAVLTLMMVVAMIPVAFAEQHEDPTAVEVVMEIGSTSYTINGTTSTMDVAPYIEVGRTMVPVSFVARSFGLTSDFGPVDGLTEWVTFENENLLIEIEIGSFDITVTEGGVSRTEVADVAARIDNGRTYMPLRAVGEILGAEFDWGPKDAATEWVSFTLGVTDPAPDPDPPAPVDPDPADPTDPDPAEPTEVAVNMQNFSYSPGTITVAPGTEVVWTNLDAEAHTVTSDGNFNSGLIQPGASYSHVFDEIGTFEYYCQPHPFMVGTVTVE
jgi:plastocyanin